MALTPYVCCTKQFEEHYAGQSGSGLPYYQGIPLQKGYGLGGIFRRLFRSALPFIISGAKNVGKEALKTGAQIAGDVLSGENFKTSALRRTRDTSKILARKAIRKAESMIGSGVHKRKRKDTKIISPNKVIKKRRRDIFDA